MSRCSQACLESHTFLLLSLRRIKVSGEQTLAIYGHPNVWHLVSSNRQRGTTCKRRSGETALGLGKKTQTHEEPICLAAEDALTPERACARRGVGQEGSGEGALAAGCGGDQPAGAPGAVST